MSSIQDAMARKALSDKVDMLEERLRNLEEKFENRPKPGRKPGPKPKKPELKSA